MKPNTYKILVRAVEEGVAMGYNRAHKYDDAPTQEIIVNKIIDEVINSICEVFDFEISTGE